MTLTDPLRFGTGSALIVAEIGNNHEGRIDVALELIRMARSAGVDAVKFQTHRTELFVRRSDAVRFERLKRWELTAEDWQRLARTAREHGLRFIATPLDLESARMLTPLVDAFKIASGDITFAPLVRAVAAAGKPVILSSGASDLTEIRGAVEVVEQTPGFGGAVAVLHCVSCYPAPDDQASLGAIPSLARELGRPIGYSDHTLGIDAVVGAVALGACIVEKHFTLDKHFSEFRDHQLSADPPELGELVVRVRRLESMIGGRAKAVQACEESMRRPIRRSIVARVDLPAGHVVRAEDLAWMRPADGLAPGREVLVVGRPLKRAVASGDPILAESVE